ncbi:MAG TPA: sulfite exporter TauE/SafE family protein [Thermoleophilaceae bacterium]|nr:sulfite exporter TauE/SafE family protein [Thermoleophilaceae bacterium]
MEAGELIGLLALGLAAGVASGLLGIGGGLLFVPALVIFAELGVLEAEATSLVAVAIVAVVGAWRQRSHGNIDLRDGLLIGALSPLGVAGGVALANAVPERALEIGFAAVQLYFAFELVRRAVRGRHGEAAEGA